MFTALREIVSKRDLVWELALKDLKLRYARPALGFLWAFISPFLTVLIFYLIFSIVLKVKIEEAPFILYLMSGVFAWRLFQDSLVASTTSLLDNKNLIREARFPHYLIQASIVLANLINLLPFLAVIIAASIFILRGLPVFIVFLPAILCLHLFITIGLSIIFSILYVRWRDVKYILEAALLFLFYLTPVFYSLYLVKGSFSPLLYKFYIYNPFVGILSLYRIALLNGFYGAARQNIDFFSLVVSPLIFAFFVLAAGFYFYNKFRLSINDYLSY